MAGNRERRDLAAMIGPLVRSLLAVEHPILRAHGISMWGYSVLTALDGEPASTQAALAAAIHADKTRIIGVLDELQRAGLIAREPDPADRRANLVRITAEGVRARSAVRTDIQRAEERVLRRLPAADRATFLRVLETLSETDFST